MKKLFLTLAVLLCVATLGAQENYRKTGLTFIADVSVMPANEAHEIIDILSPCLTGSVGYQFNPYLFLGGSTGIYYNESRGVIPIMVDFRYYMMNKKCTPFLALRVGKGIEINSYAAYNDGIITIPQVGYAFGHFTVSLSVISRFYYELIADNYMGTSVSSINFYANRAFQVGLGWTF